VPLCSERKFDNGILLRAAINGREQFHGLPAIQPVDQGFCIAGYRSQEIVYLPLVIEVQGVRGMEVLRIRVFPLGEHFFFAFDRPDIVVRRFGDGRDAGESDQ